MILVMLGLALVVTTALIYAGLAASRDGVARRQTDVWAACAGVMCATLILLGAGDVRRKTTVNASTRVEDPASAQTVVRRRLRLDLRTAAAVPSALPAVTTGSGLVASAALPAAPVAQPLSAAPVEQSRSPEVAPDREPRVVAIAERIPVPQATAKPVLQPEAVGRTEVERPVAAATATPAPVRISPATATPLPPIAPIAPEPPPTVVIPAPPTPHCGEPGAIDISIDLLEAEAERDDEGELVVRYEVQLDNRSGFPVQLTSLRVTALNRTGGSEQYGVDARPDLTLPATDSLRFAGAVALRKNPGPFGRTEVCLSFVPETCGQRLPPNQRIMTRCRSVSGF